MFQPAAEVQVVPDSVPPTSGAVDSQASEGAEEAARAAPLSASQGRLVPASSDGLSLHSRVEALIFSADRPLPLERVAAALKLIRLDDDATGGNELAKPVGKPSTPAAVAAACQSVADSVAALNCAYEATGRSFRIEHIAGGYRVMTLPQFAGVVADFHRSRMGGKLTRAAIETLAIIAYKQPITRAQLEAIRGVSCGEVLKNLMDRRIVTVKGRAEELGRPMLYGTTRQFLDHFGMASIKDLPSSNELKPV